MSGKLDALCDYEERAEDYAAEVEISKSELDSVFYDHINEYDLDDTEYPSFSKNILQGIPWDITWSIQEASEDKSIITANFYFPGILRKNLWIIAGILGFLNIVYFPRATDNFLESSFRDRGFLYSAETLVMLASFFLTGLTGHLLSRYRIIAHETLQRFSDKHLDGKEVIKLDHSQYPCRLFNYIYLFFLVFLVVTLIPVFNVTGVFSYIPFFLKILGLLFIIGIFLTIRSLFGSIYYAKIAVISTNIFLSLGNVLPLLVMPILLKIFLQMPVNANNEVLERYGVEIEEVYRNIDLYPKSIEPLANIWSVSRTLAVMILIFYIIFYALRGMVMYFGGQSISRVFIGNTLHNKNIKYLFEKKDKRSNTSRTINLRLPSYLKALVWIMFVCLSATLWYCVYINISIILAFCFPDNPVLHFGYGKEIYLGSSKLINILTIGRNSNSYFNFLVVAPLLLFFLKFIFDNFYYALKSSFRYIFLSRADVQIQNIADNAASFMKVKNVKCVIDKKRKSMTPLARKTDWGKNIIILSSECKSILIDGKVYAKAIIAHEIAHLKRDCVVIRKYTLLSRLGLVGTGFLSVLHDSISLEDNADDEAKKYLRHLSIDPDTLRDSVYFISYEEQAGNDNIIKPKHVDSINESKLAKKYYYEIEAYDYIHRDARCR